MCSINCRNKEMKKFFSVDGNLIKRERKRNHEKLNKHFVLKYSES